MQVGPDWSLVESLLSHFVAGSIVHVRLFLQLSCSELLASVPPELPALWVAHSVVVEYSCILPKFLEALLFFNLAACVLKCPTFWRRGAQCGARMSTQCGALGGCAGENHPGSWPHVVPGIFPRVQAGSVFLVLFFSLFSRVPLAPPKGNPPVLGPPISTHTQVDS